MIDITKAALVTHQGCMDGSACAIVFAKAGGLLQNVRFSSPNHRDVDELVEDLLNTWPGPIILADISISLSLANKIRRDDVLLFDHHKSAVPLAGLPWCEIDKENSRCGSKILYEWLEKYEDSLLPYKDFIDTIDDHDRWVKNIPNSDELALLHEVLGQDLFIERFLKHPAVSFFPNEEYVLRIEKHKRDKFVENKKNNLSIISKKIGGHDLRVAFVQAGTHQSQLGNSICSDPIHNVDIAVLIGGNSISLRASPTCPVDLSAVAKLNGGGGHMKAAGCSIDKLLGQNLVDFVAEKLKFE